MSLTIKDIARLSGVGISTVSRVINNSGYASEEVRQKVLQIIRDYDYVPNNSARSLKAVETKNIALLVKGITNPFFNKMIRIIEEKCALNGYPLFIQNVDNHTNELDLAIREKRDRNLCGVIIMGGTFDYAEEKLNALNIPCVLVTVSADNTSNDLCSSVKIDDEKEAFEAVDYLIQLGHRSIGFIYDPPTEKLTPNRLRFLGYCRALEKHGIEFRENLIAENTDAPLHSGYITGFNAAKSLIRKNPDMTAIFAFADVLALGAIKGALSEGLRVPEDLSVIGFDGIEEGEFFNPSLTTIHQPADEMALSSIGILFDMIQGGKSQHKVFNAVLLRRESTKAR